MNTRFEFIYFTAIYLIYSAAGGVISPTNVISGSKFNPKEIDVRDKLITGIAGGENSTITEHNYIAALTHDGLFVGSAIILNKKWLVTAAWNVYWASPESYTVRVGSSYTYKQGKQYSVKSVVIYPNYDEEWIYDIALIQLKKSLKFSKKVKSISLAASLPKNGTETVVSGWGWDKYSAAGTQILKKARVPFIDYKTCKPHYTDTDGFTNYSICTYKEGVGPCAKDFGSPLVYKKKLIGVYSGAFECAGTKRPPVYADVTKYKKWIEEKIKHNTDNGYSEIEEEETNENDEETVEETLNEDNEGLSDAEDEVFLKTN